MAEPLPVYALTVRQPMAWAIISGLKDTENRSWRPARPVRLLIHAGVTFDRQGAAFITGLGVELPQTFVRGAIIGTVVAAAFTTDCPSRWAEPGSPGTGSSPGRSPPSRPSLAAGTAACSPRHRGGATTSRH